jgi:predicted phage terminase large subunit-like protein
MNAPFPPSVILQAIRREREIRAAESSLYEFTRQAWHVIEPGTPFVEGWHLKAIAEHLEAVTDGDIRRIVINIPPRHMKSIQVAVMWPVWVWIARPEFRWLFASYAGSLSVRDSLKCRRLIQSPWFQERWGHLFRLTGDQNAKTFFENDKYGYRFATSVGAATTGHGGDGIVIDDPHNALEAQSDAMRESTLEWFDQAMSTRLNDPRTGAIVIVMQRLHEADLAGHVLKAGGYEHLCLPAEFEGVRFKTSIGWEDPREANGSLLWPERFGRDEIDSLKKSLGEYGTAGQLQQRPAPAGGGILKPSKVQLWPVDKPMPSFDFILQSYDTAFTEKTTNDPTACTVYGVFTDEGRRGVMIMDAWSDNMEYPDLRAKVISDWRASYGGDDEKGRRGRKADALLIEEKGSGISLIQELRQANIPAQSYNPGRADKISRAHQVAPILDLGCVYVLESSKRPGQWVSWADDLKAQMERFPNADHDDYIDTLTQALIFLRDSSLLELDYFEGDEVEEIDYATKRRSNPYDE